MEDYKKSSWTNGSWEISWKNQDEVRIQGHNRHVMYIDGGDFEYALQVMMASYRSGMNLGRDTERERLKQAGKQA